MSQMSEISMSDLNESTIVNYLIENYSDKLPVFEDQVENQLNQSFGNCAIGEQNLEILSLQNKTFSFSQPSRVDPNRDILERERSESKSKSAKKSKKIGKIARKNDENNTETPDEETEDLNKTLTDLDLNDENHDNNKFAKPQAIIDNQYHNNKIDPENPVIKITWKNFNSFKKELLQANLLQKYFQLTNSHEEDLREKLNFTIQLNFETDNIADLKSKILQQFPQPNFNLNPDGENEKGEGQEAVADENLVKNLKIYTFGTIKFQKEGQKNYTIMKYVSRIDAKTGKKKRCGHLRDDWLRFFL